MRIAVNVGSYFLSVHPSYNLSRLTLNDQKHPILGCKMQKYSTDILHTPDLISSYLVAGTIGTGEHYARELTIELLRLH